MSDLLRSVVIMTITGSVLALALFALKPFVNNRLPKATQYYLWLVVIAALLVPFSKLVTLPFANDNSMLALTPNSVAQKFVVTTQEERDRVQAVQRNYTTAEIATDYHYIQEVKQAQSPISEAVSVFAYLYPLGAVCVFGYFVITYLAFCERLKRRNVLTDIKREIPVYCNPLASTPMLIGFFKPSIVLPDREYTDEQVAAVIAHEMTHHRRKDVLVRWLTVAACAVHWFNPLVWLVRREIDHACELSCDEAVIRNLDLEGKQSYGDTLLYVAANTKAPRSALAMCEEKRDLKERLGAIMKAKKRGVLAVCVSAALLVTLAACAALLGAGSEAANSSDLNLADFSVNGFALGMNIDDIDTSSLVPTDEFDGSYQYNYRDANSAEIRYSADAETNSLRKIHITVVYGGAYIPTVRRIDGSAEYIPYELKTAEQVKNFFGKGTEGWHDREQKLRYIEYVQKSGQLSASVRFVYAEADGGLVWVIAESSLPHPKAFDVSTLATLRTPYVGNNSAVGKIVNALPSIGWQHTQNFFSIGDDYSTGKAPNTLTVYYEQDGKIQDDYAITPRNAVLLFALIDNLEEVSYAIRTSPSGDTLDKSAYLDCVTYTRVELGDYLATVGLTWESFQDDWNTSVEKAFALIGDGRVADLPHVTLYSYDSSIDPANPDFRIRLGECLTAEDNGWTRLSGEVFVDVAIVPVGTVRIRTYYAEAGSEAEAHIMADFTSANPLRGSQTTNDGMPRGNSWNIANYYPSGFMGHIWAVTTDADGTEHQSEIVNVVYEPQTKQLFSSWSPLADLPADNFNC